MHPDRIDKLNGFGVLFRYTTPVFNMLLTIISTLILTSFSTFKATIVNRCDRLEIQINDLKFDIKEYGKTRVELIKFYDEERVRLAERVIRNEERLEELRGRIKK
jgi:hypothetical protein